VPTVSTPITTPNTSNEQTIISQVFNNSTVDASDVHLATLTAIKYGSAIKVGQTVEQNRERGAFQSASAPTASARMAAIRQLGGL
jgi:hypothetical protein